MTLEFRVIILVKPNRPEPFGL